MTLTCSTWCVSPVCDRWVCEPVSRLYPCRYTCVFPWVYTRESWSLCVGLCISVSRGIRVSVHTVGDGPDRTEGSVGMTSSQGATETKT